VAVEDWSTVEGESGITTYKLLCRGSDKCTIAMFTAASGRSPEEIEIVTVEPQKHALLLKNRDGKVVCEL